MFSNILLVGLGGGVGSILRYFIQRSMNASYPWGTFAVNITGCLAIGLLWGLFTKQVDEPRRLLMVTGLCGGFTTFSSFTYEGMELMMQNRWLPFFMYVTGSVVIGLLATYAGFKLTS